LLSAAEAQSYLDAESQRQESEDDSNSHKTYGLKLTPKRRVSYSQFGASRFMDHAKRRRVFALA